MVYRLSYITNVHGDIVRGRVASRDGQVVEADHHFAWLVGYPASHLLWWCARRRINCEIISSTCTLKRKEDE